MRSRTGDHSRDHIIDAVLELLGTGGYEAVQLREVARRAHVSLATIYRQFPTRSDLVVDALQRWMSEASYAPFAQPEGRESLYEGLMRVFRHVFEPWERSPLMLQAFHMALTGPGGDRLQLQGVHAVVPVARGVLAEGDPAYVEDIELILTNMAYAVIGRFADGELPITSILPSLERAVFRLTTNNEPAARSAGRALPADTDS